MSKVTSKLQVTIPKALAEQYGIGPGAEIAWEPCGDTIRVLPPGARGMRLGLEERLALFDRDTRWIEARCARQPLRARRPAERGWTRAELYERGGAG